jgi:16S rRNA (cytosine967-C5)-methyltransferase
VVTSENDKSVGWQILPNEQSMDGFYYAKLEKQQA